MVKENQLPVAERQAERDGWKDKAAAQGGWKADPLHGVAGSATRVGWRSGPLRGLVIG